MMKKTLHTFVGICLLLAGTTGCSKNNDAPEGTEGHKHQGTLYYKWADEGTLKLNIGTGEKSLLLPTDVKQNGFFVNKSQNKILVLSDIQGDPDNESLKIINLPDGSLITEIKVDKGNHSGFVHPQLSVDEKYMLAQSLLPEKVIVIEISAKKAYILNEINGQKITDAVWMPDGSVLLGTEQAIYRSSVPFDEIQEIKKLDFVKWSSLAVSPDGQKIVFKGGQHLWMMNAEGNNLKQITHSATEEGAPTFSPDSKYLLVGIQQFAGGAGTWGGYFTMYIIPADGQQYTIEEGKNTQNVHMVIAKEEQEPETYNGLVQWLE